MPLPVSARTNSDYKKVPQGTHVAVCNLVADLGMQETTWKGQSKRVPQVYLRFETPNERVEYEKDGVKHEGPLSIGVTYTASLGEKANLRHALESWRGRAFTEEELAGFDLFNVLGKPCLITVTHKDKNGNLYANITAITGLPKGTQPPRAENELLRYSPDEPGEFAKLPEWLREKIGKAQPQAPAGEDLPTASSPGIADDDIPF